MKLITECFVALMCHQMGTLLRPLNGVYSPLLHLPHVQTDTENAVSM